MEIREMATNKVKQRVERLILGGVLSVPKAVAALQAPHRVDGDPLCPQIQLFLGMLNATPRPGMHEVSLETARRQYEFICKMTDGRGPSVPRLENRTIPGPAGEIPVRIYGPVSSGAALPALVYYHGGGFVLGSPEVTDAFCRRVALRARCVVISVDYRLAPEHPFPAAIEDCVAAFGWVLDEARSLGIDPKRVAVGGDSAGAKLAAVVSILRRDADLPGPCHQMLYYPTTAPRSDADSHRLFGSGYFLDSATIQFFRECYVGTDPVDDFRSSPLLTRDLKGLPSAQVITAGFDPLRDEGRAYAARLAEAGVRVDDVLEKRLIHGFVAMDFSRIAREANTRAMRRLGAALETSRA
jgi:acetyl esterase